MCALFFFFLMHHTVKKMPQCNTDLNNNHKAGDEVDSVLDIAGVLKHVVLESSECSYTYTGAADFS